MIARPRVSIGLPVYNGQKYLAQTLESLLGQDYSEFELIISDNASTDATAEICQAYAGQDRRIRYYRNERNLGAAANYNRVFQLAVGQYFKWAPHDDLYAPRYLRACVEALDESSAEVVLAYPRTLVIDEQGAIVGEHVDELDTRGLMPSERLARMLANPISWCHAVLGVIRTGVLRTTRLIGSYCGSDQTLMAELALRGAFYEVDEPLFLRRVNEGESPSLHANASAEEVAAWFDTTKRDHVPMRWTRLLWEHVQAIRLARLSWSDTLACLKLLKTSPFAGHWQRETVLREIRRSIREAGARRAMNAIRHGQGYYLPHRTWALWDGIKYRKPEWLRLAFSLPTRAAHAALNQFVAIQLSRRTDRASREMLKEWMKHGCDEYQSTVPLASVGKSSGGQ